MTNARAEAAEGGRRLNVLVVDDEPDLREMVSFEFELKGHHVHSAENGSSAFDVFQKNNIDIVITDVRMPGGDGPELLDNVKSKNPEVPVIFITGFSDITLEDAYDRGVEAVFSKPFHLKDLVVAAERAVTPKDTQWKKGEIPESEMRRSARVDSDFSIKMKVDGIESARKTRVLNIGRGGAFIHLVQDFPQINDTVKFTIVIENPDRFVSSIDGIGRVRWVRTKGDETCPSGCGIQFSKLSDTARKGIIELINDLKTKQFIPKS